MSINNGTNTRESNVLEIVQTLLKKSDYIGLHNYCIKKENAFQISENGLNLLSLMMNFLKDNEIEKESLKYFEMVFFHISLVSKPKEIFLGILEQFDPMTDFLFVNLLFSSLKECCRLLMNQDLQNSCNNLNMLFSTLLYYVESINLPKYDNYEPITNFEDTEEIKVSIFISNCVDLTDSSYNEVMMLFDNGHLTKEEIHYISMELLDFCSVLLERLSYLDLEELSIRNFDDHSTSSNFGVPNSSFGLSNDIRKSTHAAITLSELLRKLKPPFELFHNLDWTKYNSRSLRITEEDHKKFELARAVFVYLNIVNSHVSQYFPQILDSYYIYHNILPCILTFWKTTNPLHMRKGMELIEVVNDRISPQTLQASALNHHLKFTIFCNNVGHELLETAIHIAVHCQIMVLRQRAIDFIKCFLDKFDWCDRYNILLHLFTTSKHPGILGYLIGYLKDKLAELLQARTTRGTIYFLEKKRLKKFFILLYCLSDGSETDLLSEYDKIISSLNLLRYLIIRDSSNKTGIRQCLAMVKQKFLEPLHTAINLSRMHFRDEFQKSQRPGDVAFSEPALTINGISLPTLSLRDRKEALTSAINSFDLLQSICVRVQELSEQHSSTNLDEI